MSEENNKTPETNIGLYFETLPKKLDSTKNISLYSLMKKYCPQTVRKISARIYGTKRPIDVDNKWYAALLNYLVKKEILEPNVENNRTFHEVIDDDYKMFFTHPTSTAYTTANCKNHLILYKDTSKAFLIKAGIIDKDGNEILGEKKKDNDKNFLKKYSKQIRWISWILFVFTLINFVLMISKYGLIMITPFLTNTCLFSLSLIFITDNKN